MTRTALILCASLVALPVCAQQPQQTATRPETAGVEAPDHVLQDGTPVKLQLTKALSSADAEVGQKIAFAVVDDIDIDGVTVLRRGTLAVGTVTEAVTKKRMGRAGRVNFNITDVTLADGKKAPLRAVSNSKGDSHVSGMVGLMLNLPVAAAPFMLLLKGTDSSFPKGTEIIAFIDGDMHLELAKFGGAPHPTAPGASSLAIDSDPAGADIEIDGAPSGATPGTVALTPGVHHITVRKKGFIDWTQTVEANGGTPPVKAVLEKVREQ